ncbi:unnamed protein product [Brachionus calyciflorus]|uniref:Uncharacterized protein n=1 Tax=Brachionus calyciflorus TaxID=104777 RepID=A0A813X959_9BILA|nr:unnamed protein product [Brachionus calyciflorus]
MVQSIELKSTEKSKLKIRVKDYNDYSALTQNWPTDAFKNDIKAYPSAPKLYVRISDVKQKLKITKENTEIKELSNK